MVFDRLCRLNPNSFGGNRHSAGFVDTHLRLAEPVHTVHTVHQTSLLLNANHKRKAPEIMQSKKIIKSKIETMQQATYLFIILDAEIIEKSHSWFVVY